MKAGVVITLVGMQNGPGPLHVPQVRHMHTFHASTCSLPTSTDFSLSYCWLRHGLKKTQARVGYLLELEARRAGTGYHVTNRGRDVRLDSLAVTTWREPSK